MITKEQAMNAHHREEFHYTGVNPCTLYEGPRGGRKYNRTVVRVIGLCKTWKTRPDEFRLPIRHGLKASGAITHDNAHNFHRAQDCPLTTPQTADDQ